MIDPQQIDQVAGGKLSLKQEFLLFSVTVHGKQSLQQAVKLDEFLAPREKLGLMPFGYVRYLRLEGRLEDELRKVKLGQYKRLSEAFYRLALLDPENLTLAQLEAIPGVGLKTSRFILLTLQPDAQVAALDTHILGWLRDLGFRDAPAITPTSRKAYQRWEQCFLKLARAFNFTPAQLDLKVWRERSGGTANA